MSARGSVRDTAGMDDQARVLAFPKAPDAVELRHLRSFVAVAEELNFGRAAEQLYLSQPALSRQIRALEQFVGVQLLRRSTHRVELTLAGESLLERARKILTEVDEAIAVTQSVGGELAGRSAGMWQALIDLVEAGAGIDALRDGYEAMHAQFGPPAEVTVRPASAGGVSSLLVSAPDQPAVGILYLHGGGYQLGSAFGYRHLAGALALAADAGAVVPDYRLAPEHPYPAALDDALAAYQWLAGRATGPTVVAGDSSGGHLALSVLLALKRDGLPQPAGAVLLCPGVDMMRVPEARPAAEAYLGAHAADDPLLSPLKADLTGLPPMLVQAATGDDYCDQAQELAEVARSHGVDARLELYPVATHVFQVFWSFLPEAAEALESAGRFVREVRKADMASAGTTSTAAG
jgi:monoterpene epsilon-lactone hydrolase